MYRPRQFRKLMLAGFLVNLFYLPGACQVAIQPEPVASGNAASHSATQAGYQFDDNAKTWYRVYNDSTTIHVVLKITDSLQQLKALMNGLQLWVDIKAKKNKTIGILFPLQVKMPPGLGAHQTAMGASFTSQDRGNDPDNLHQPKKVQSLISLQREMEVVGFIPELNGRQNINHPSGLNVSLHVTNDTLLYEAIIPFRVFAKLPSLNSTISIGIIEKGMPAHDFDSGDMPPGNEPMPGDDGPPPGPPPDDRQDGKNMQKMIRDDIIWQKFALRVQ